MKKTTLPMIFLYLFLVGNLTVSCGKNTFTGIYVADSRPSLIMYMGLTQTEDNVSGSIVIVEPDGQGSTKSTTLAVQGNTDGRTLTITADRVFGDLVISGRKQGETVELLIPNNSGTISNVLFKPTSESEYNLAVRQWQEELAAIHQEKAKLEKREQENLAARKREMEIQEKLERERLTEKNKENEKLERLASELSDLMDAIKSTGITRNLTDLGAALGDEKSALLELERNFAELKHNASIRPMTCYQAYSTAAYDYNSTMAYSYNSTLGYAHKEFITVLAELEKRLSNAPRYVAEITRLANALRQAIDESKYPAPELSVSPGDEKPVLGRYHEIATSARTDLALLKATHIDILEKAKMIMREGEVTLKAAQQLVSCD